MIDLPRRLVAEGLGTAMLVATVVGSGIMAETLTKDLALALLANTIATGAILVVLISCLGPISGAHFNPVVSLVFNLRRELPMWACARDFAIVHAPRMARSSSTVPPAAKNAPTSPSIAAMIVECKIVHPATGRTLSDYCTEGIDRFVSRDYAWGSAEGFMLVYVRDGSTPAKHLAKHLVASPHATTAPLKRLMRAIGAGETHHHRTFRYPSRRPPDDDPKSIKLWHLWL